MVEPAGTALVGAAVWGQALYHSWRPRRVGIYGAPLVGKTTLDRYMTTPGEMEAISDEDRTTHGRLLGVAGPYRMPSPTRKRISWNGDKRVVFSADIGGPYEVFSIEMEWRPGAFAVWVSATAGEAGLSSARPAFAWSGDRADPASEAGLIPTVCAERQESVSKTP